jgi:EAL domain-containing protein (putative c-di-GMP-specific phosphodiesterase class I)
VLQLVVQQIHQWQSSQIPVVPVAINISGLQLKKQSLSTLIAQVLKEYQVDPSYLELEFTESVFIEDSEKTEQEITALKEMGLAIALDDFGSCYSSFFYLRRFAVDHIKIDQSFIKDILTNEKSRALVLAIINMGHNLNVPIIAEGVETAEQYLFLKEYGVDEMQGNYLGLPSNSDSTTALLKTAEIAVPIAIPVK